MSGDVRKVINLVGIVLILGLVLRYWQAAYQLIGVSGNTFSQIYSTVSLQNLKMPQQAGPISQGGQGINFGG